MHLSPQFLVPVSNKPFEKYATSGLMALDDNRPPYLTDMVALASGPIGLFSATSCYVLISQVLHKQLKLL